MKQSIQTLYFILYLGVYLEANIIEMRMLAERAKQVLPSEEFIRQDYDVREVVSTFEYEIKHPAMLNLGQLMNPNINPISPKVLLIYEVWILYFVRSIFPLTHILQMTSEQTPLNIKTKRPPPPSNDFNPFIIIAEQRLNPNAITDPIMMQTCQYMNIPTKSKKVKSTESETNIDLVIKVNPTSNDELNPEKTESQKTPIKKQNCAVTDTTISSETRVQKLNLRNGVYMSVNENISMRQLLKREPYVVERDSRLLVRAKMPRKSTAIISKIITIVANINDYYQFNQSQVRFIDIKHASKSEIIN